MLPWATVDPLPSCFLPVPAASLLVTLPECGFSEGQPGKEDFGGICMIFYQFLSLSGGSHVCVTDWFSQQPAEAQGGLRVHFLPQ